MDLDFFYLVFFFTVFSIGFHLQDHLVVPVAARVPAITSTFQENGEEKGRQAKGSMALKSFSRTIFP